MNFREFEALYKRQVLGAISVKYYKKAFIKGNSSPQAKIYIFYESSKSVFIKGIARGRRKKIGFHNRIF